jgi:hypothetical protein
LASVHLIRGKLFTKLFTRERDAGLALLLAAESTAMWSKRVPRFRTICYRSFRLGLAQPRSQHIAPKACPSENHTNSVLACSLTPLLDCVTGKRPGRDRLHHGQVQGEVPTVRREVT